jgi:hypothetical protein
MLYPFLWDLISVMSPATVMLSYSLCAPKGRVAAATGRPGQAQTGTPTRDTKAETPLARWITASLPVTIQRPTTAPLMPRQVTLRLRSYKYQTFDKKQSPHSHLIVTFISTT